MIAVSNEFKNAIKSKERRIKGYVEVLYDIPSVVVAPSTNITNTYSKTSELVNGVRVENLYGSLDYLPLDGSRLTMGATNTNIGFISDDLFENILYPAFTFQFDSTTIKGITLYFRENIPTSLTVTCSDGTIKTISDNTKDTIQIIFDEPITIIGFGVVINSMQYPDRKIYFMEADLGITQVYKDRDLLDFTVDEEINKLVEEVPVNEVDITINNMYDLFNPLNPTGIVPYLTSNTLIKPYVGVLTDTLGIEYVKMGEFYFESYTNNSDSTTTLVGKNIIKRIETQELIDDNESAFFTAIMNEEEFTDYASNYDFTITNDNWTRDFVTSSWKDTSLLKFLKDVAFYQDNLLFADRNSNVKLTNINKTSKDTLSKSELLDDVSFKYIDKINVVKLIRPYATTEDAVTERTVLESSVILTKPVQVFLFKMDYPLMASSTITQSGAMDIETISAGQYMAFVKITGNVGANVTVTFKSTSNKNITNLEYILEDTKRDKDIVLEFNSDINIFGNTPSGYIKNSDILEKAPSYEMRFDYNGDPSLEAGDYINVETPYGYKPLFIQRNRIKFDGGLEGSIEGVE